MLPYIERDQAGSHTMLSGVFVTATSLTAASFLLFFCSSSLHSSHVGDIVLFNIASDRRMGSKQPRRATNVKLHKMVEMNQGNQSREKVSGVIRFSRSVMCYAVVYMYMPVVYLYMHCT